MSIVVGLDPGLAHFGAVALMLPERRVVAADVWTSGHDDTVTKLVDYAARCDAATSWLADIIRGWQPDAVAAEGTAGMGEGGDEAKGRKPRRVNHAAVYTIWGATIGTVRGATMRSVIPVHQATWKRHLVPKGKVTDVALYAALGAAGGDAIDGLLRTRRVQPSMRVHALDALGVALYAARQDGRWLEIDGSLG